MKCEHVQKKMPLLCGGDLTPEDEREALHEHIQGCDECARELAEYQESRQVFDRLKQDGLSEDFWDLFKADLEAELSDLPSPAQRRAAAAAESGSSARANGSYLRTAVSAAAIFLLGIGLGYFSKPFVSGIRSGQTTSPDTPVSPNNRSGNSEDPVDEMDPRDTEPVHNQQDSRTVQRDWFRDDEHHLDSEDESDTLLINPIEDLQRTSWIKADTSD